MNKSIYRDIFINIMASSLCTAVLNLIVYPGYAKRFSASDYGNILTVVALIHLLIAVLGNCLNNTRLILNKSVFLNNEEGNYNLILLIVSTIGSLIGVAAFSLFQISTLISSVLLFLTVFFGIARAYFVVYYRLTLNYYSQLKANIIASTGYILGLVVFSSMDWWPLPLCVGETVSFIYTFKKGTLHNEPFRFTEDKWIVISTYADLILIGIIGNILAYFDRFLINPTLGAASVAVISVASFWGKSVTPLTAPIANVLLSYLCQKDTIITIRRFIMIFISTFIPLLLFGLIGIWIGPWVTGLLFPTLIQAATPYLIIASIGSLVHSSTALLNPVLLSICSSRAILGLQLINFSIYLIVVFLGAYKGGLYGFCVANLAVGLIKTTIYFCFGYFILKKGVNRSMES